MVGNHSDDESGPEAFDELLSSSSDNEAETKREMPTAPHSYGDDSAIPNIPEERNNWDNASPKRQTDSEYTPNAAPVDSEGNFVSLLSPSRESISGESRRGRRKPRRAVKPLIKGNRDNIESDRWAHDAYDKMYGQEESPELKGSRYMGAFFPTSKVALKEKKEEVGVDRTDFLRDNYYDDKRDEGETDSIPVNKYKLDRITRKQRSSRNNFS